MSRVVVAVDDFNRADNADLGAAWDPYDATDHLRITTNEVHGTSASTADILLEAHTATLANDQWAEATLSALGANYSEAGVAIRMATPSTRTYYTTTPVHDGGDADWYIQEITAGAGATLVGPVTIAFAANDVVLLMGRLSVLTLYVNGVERLQVSDTTLTGGRAGLGIYSTVTIGDTRWNNFSCGNVFAVEKTMTNRRRRV